MKKYFLYEIKKSLPAAGYLTLSMTAWYLILILLFSITRLEDIFYNLVPLMFFAGAVAVLSPIKIFTYRTKKRSVDLYYSLPLSHRKILTVKFLTGLAVLYASYTVAFFIGMAASAIKTPELNAVYYIPLYFASLIPLYILYSVSAFAFTRAYKKTDGILFIVFWFAVIPVVLEVIDRIFYVYGFQPNYLLNCVINAQAYSPTYPLSFVTEYFGGLISNSFDKIWWYEFTPANQAVVTANIIAGLTLNALLSIGATAGLFLLEKHTKAENAGQISDSLFGYKTMIPIYTVCCLSLCISGSTALNVVAVVMTILISTAITVIYKRTVKIGWKQAVAIAAPIVAGIALGALFTL